MCIKKNQEQEVGEEQKLKQEQNRRRNSSRRSLYKTNQSSKIAAEGACYLLDTMALVDYISYMEQCKVQ